MTLEPHAFMTTMKKRIVFTNEDKALLKLQSDWGKQIAADMAEHFYSYLGRDVEMNAIMNAKEGRIHRLRENFI